MASRVALAGALLLVCGPGRADSADLSGTVLSSDGKVVPELALHLTGLGRFQTIRTSQGRVEHRPVKGAEPVQAGVKPRADGSFTLRGLHDGVYLVCAVAPPPFLNPCDWARPFGFEVRSGRVVGGAVWRLDSGTTLEIRVEDPGKALPAKEDSIGAPAVSCGVVSSTKAHVRTKLVQSESGGRLYRVAVPAGHPVTLSLSSRLVRFLAADGRALAFPHADINIGAQQKGATLRVVVTAQALTPAEKEQVKFK